MPLVQDDRLIRMSKGPLGASEVLLTSFSGREAISRLFQFQFDFVSTKLDLKASDLIGKDLTIEVDRRDVEGNPQTPRFFHGYINRFTAGDVSLHGAGDVQYRAYRAQMVPWPWMLTQTARCFLYFPEKEDKTVYEIIEAVFQRAQSELGLKAAQFDLSGINDLKQRTLKHCAQYRESDFNFVSRIMEQFGAYYYFKHEDGKHTLVASVKNNYPKCEEAEVTFPDRLGSQSQTDHIIAWEHSYELVSGKFAHTDYNFETPSTNLLANSAKIAADVVSESSKLEVYDYPGEYAQKSDGDGEARVRQEEEESAHNVVRASGHCKTFMPGHTFQLSGHPDQDVVSEHKQAFLLTSVMHQVVQPGPEGDASGGYDYSNQFTCIPSALQFRPARITPKPVISGIQTAVVVGPAGEEIHTDEYGRVKVCFHWDREENRKKEDEGEKFFCWVRVAHNIAGKQWGFMAIPRIGQEVVVDFLEGDPDQPLIVGSVYNAEQMPHYALPDDKTKTYIKTNSSMGGDGFNELMFEDKKDDERVFIHAQKNMDTRVLNDSKTRILNDRHQIIGGEEGGDQREMVWQDKHLDIKRNQVEHIEGNMQLMIGNGAADDGGKLDVVVEKKMTELIGEDGHDFHLKGNRKELIDKSASLAVGGDHMQTVGGDNHSQVKGNDNQKVDGSNSLDVGMNHEQTVGIKHAVDAGQEIHLKAGMKVIIEAGVQISLVGPGGFVDIGPAGVTIQGVMVKINSGGSAGSGSGASPEAPKDPARPDDAVQAAPTQPAEAHDSKTGQKSAPD